MSERQRQVATAAPRGSAAEHEAARTAKARRAAWLLALLAAFFYVGFIAWNVLRASLGI